MGAHDTYFEKPEISHDHEEPERQHPPADTIYTGASENKQRCGYQHEMGQFSESEMAMQLVPDRTAYAALSHTCGQRSFGVQKPHRQLLVSVIMPRPWQFRSVSRKPVKPQPGIGQFSSDVNPASLPNTSFSSLDSLDWPAPALLPSPMAIRSPGPA